MPNPKGFGFLFCRGKAGRESTVGERKQTNSFCRTNDVLLRLGSEASLSPGSESTGCDGLDEHPEGKTPTFLRKNKKTGTDPQQYYYITLPAEL